MAYAKKFITKHRSHESCMFQNLTDSELSNNLETRRDNSSFCSRTLSPILSNSGSLPIPTGSCSAYLGSNSADSFVMTYAVSSPISSPVPYSFGLKNFGSGLPSPVILSYSAPGSPTLDSSPRGHNSVPFFGNNVYSGEGSSVASPVPCIPKPVKICRQVSVPQSLHPQRAATLHGTPSGLRGVYSSSLRRLSHCRIGSM